MESLLTSLDTSDISSTPVYKADISDTLLETGFHMYLYLTIEVNGESIRALNHYTNFFENSSPRTIVEAVVNINKVHANDKFSSWDKNPSEYMVEKLELNIGKLDAMFSTQSSLENREKNAI